MKTLLLRLVVISVLAIPFFPADAQQTEEKPGQVRLRIIPLTLANGVTDTTLHAGFFDHPAGSGTNFTPQLKDLVFPDQTVTVQDLFLTGITNEATCAEALAVLPTYYKTNALAIFPPPDLSTLESQLAGMITKACQQTDEVGKKFADFIKAGLKQKCQQAVESCKLDKLNVGSACAQIGKNCTIFDAAVGTTLYPMQRLLLGDVRSTTGSPSVATVSDVVLSAQPVAPYPLFPVTPRPLYRAAVVGSEQFFDGIVGLSQVTELTKIVVNDSSGFQLDPNSGKYFPVVDMAGLLHGANATYYRYAPGAAIPPPLTLHSEVTGYVAADTFWDALAPCKIPNAAGQPVGVLAEVTTKAQKEQGCVQEDQPVDVAVLKLFDPADPQRDVVLVNRGAIPGEKDFSFVTVYRKRLTNLAGERFFSDLWKYAGYGQISREPYNSCVAPRADGRESLFVTGKHHVTLIQGETDLNTQQSQVKSFQVPVNAGVGWVEQGYQSFDIACGDFNHDKIPDFAVTWARLPTAEAPQGDFAPFVSIYYGKGNNNFVPGPVVQAPPIQDDGDKAATPVKTEFMALTRCDLNRDGLHDLCVGDQFPHLINGKQEAYAIYFPLQLNGTVNPDKIQRLRVNTRTDFIVTAGRGGVRVIAEDRHHHLLFGLGDPIFHRTPVTFYCVEDVKAVNAEGEQEIPGDQVPSYPKAILVDGEVVLWNAMPDSPQKTLLEAMCDIDNCDYVANPKQEDGNNNGAGDACDDTDKDGTGDAKDGDIDGDGFVNGLDKCPFVPSSNNAFNQEGCPP